MADARKPQPGFADETDLDLDDLPLESRALVVLGTRGLEVHDLPNSGELTIGRSESCEITVVERSVSRRHATLQVSDAGVTLRDLDSTHGSFVNGERLASGVVAPLEPGEPFAIGRVTLMIQQRARRPAVVNAELSPMGQVRELVERIAPGRISVLLLGESGVGKEITAERIHRLTARAGGPYVTLNCAALSETLLESELFGHERGAFTGAVQAKPGLLESASGGTAFLDEIGELPASLQVKLLRVVEERKVRRVGAIEPIDIDVRFIAATNRDLEAEVAAGDFRQDLYYRLAGASVRIPPLRERRSEIEPLAETFLEEAATDLGRPAPSLSGAARRWLRRHDWPGNVRELRNVIERAVLLATGDTVDVAHLPATEPIAAPPQSMKAEIQQEVEAIEKQRILEALEACAGNQTRAAEMLGMSRRALINRLDAYGIPRPRKGRK
jgi:transcriptional regulator with PAS, ATPase and Fis domain